MANQDYEKQGKSTGFAFLRANCLNAVMHRSGINGFIFRIPGRDENSVVPLRGPGTPEAAFRLASSRLGTQSQGVVPLKACFGARLPKDFACEAKRLMEPELAEAIGDALFATPPAELLAFRASGLPNSMSDLEIVQNLAMHDLLGTKWTC